jgi:TonB-dependent starch-binding outer membrane protein SusC
VVEVLRATMDSKVGKKFKIGFNTLNNLSITHGGQFGLNMFPILSLSPLMPAYNADGSILKAPAGNIDDQLNTYSPLMVKENDGEWEDKVRRIRTFNSIYGEYEIIDGLKYRLNVGLDYANQEDAQFRGADTYFRPRLGNTASVRNRNEWSYTIEHLLSYNKTIASNHRIGATALFSVQQSQYHDTYLSKDSINAEFIQYYDLGQSNQSITNLPTYSGAESKWGLISYMLRLNYAYKDKYMVTITGRRDGSSRLGGKYTNYPAVSLGWNIANESFMQSQKIVSELKLRVGWGQTSNQAINPYASLGGVTSTIANGNTNVPVRYNYGPTIVQGYYVGTAPNANLDWEYTRTTNVGLDFGILEGRITGSVDVHNAQTNNILYSLALPSSSGIPGNFTTNIGEMENKGVEIQISSKNLELANGFRWETDFNVFWNRNKLVKLNDGFEKNITNGLHLGQPLSAIYDYKKLGVWQNDEATEAAKFGQLPGQLKIANLSGPEGKPDDTINQFDQTVIGSGQAKWQGGITNRFYFKGFDLSIVAYMRFGGLLNSAVYAPYGGYLTELNGRRNQVKVDYWTPTNPTNKFPMPSAQITPPNAANAWTTLGYYDASFVKIRSINWAIPSPKIFWMF